jgi:quercetin dioxygenase-like cupin family protein
MEPQSTFSPPAVPSVDAGTWEEARVQEYDPALFTGEVERRSLQSGDEMAAPGVSWVLFRDGARTNWHVHGGGQVLYILDGRGCVVTEGVGATLPSASDLVRTPAGVRHWHGALRGESMTQLAVTCGGTHFADPPDRPEPLD